MIPQELLIENFKSHKRTHIDCTQFNSVLISGSYKNDSKKSNGVGKTTIFDAIEYVLFGYAEVDLLDDIVLDNCEKCSVSFTFDLTNVKHQGTYKIVRTRNKKTSKSEVFLFQVMTDKTEKNISQKTAKETDAEIIKIIGISQVSFRNSVYFAQRDMFGLASATPKDRKNIFKEPLQITIYNKYEKLAKEKLSALQKNIDSLQSQITAFGDPDSKIKHLNEEILLLEEDLKKIESNKLSFLSSLNDSKEKLLKLKSTISLGPNDIKSKIDELSKKIRIIVEEAESTESDISKSDKQIEDIKKTIEKYNLTIASNKKTISEKKKLISDLEGLILDKDELDSKLASTKKNEANGIVMIANLESDVSRLKKPMQFDESCINCKQEISKEYWEQYESSRLTQLSESLAKLAKYKSELDKVIKKRKDLENKIYDNSLNLSKIDTMRNNVLTLESSIQDLISKTDSSATVMQQLSSSKQNLVDLHAQKLTAAAKLNEEIISLQSSCSNDNSLELVSELEIIVKNEEIKLSELLGNENECKIKVGTNNALIKKFSDDAATVQQLKAKDSLLRDDLSVVQAVVQAFSSGGIPTFIINTVIDDLQVEANKILAEIRPEIEIIFSVAKNRSDGQQEDTLDISYRVHGANRSYKQLSGGQKWFVALGLKMGLSIIIQKRLGVDIRILEFDEIDEPMDPVGKESFWNLIKKWQQTFKIFIISHDEYIKSKFSNTIVIENDPDIGSFGRLINESSN